MPRSCVFSAPTSDSPSIEQLFKACRDHGFEGLVLSPEQYGSFLGNPAGFLGRWGDWSPRMAGLIARADVGSDTGREHIGQVIDLAVGIDGNLLLLSCAGPPLSSRMEEAPVLLETLRAAAQKARGAGLRLVVKNERGSLLDSTADLRALGGLDASRSLPLALDVGHLHLCGESGADVIRETADRLEMVVLKDAIRRRFDILDPYQEEIRPLGDGDVDFAAIASALEAAGFDGTLVVEHETPIDDPAGALETASAFLSDNKFISV